MKHAASLQFPIAQRMAFRTSALAAGTGRTVDMSSSDITFLIDDGVDVPKPGTRIEMEIHWPVLLRGIAPMKLLVFGRVTRSNGYGAAVEIQRHEFRTRGKA